MSMIDQTLALIVVSSLFVLPSCASTRAPIAVASSDDSAAARPFTARGEHTSGGSSGLVSGEWAASVGGADEEEGSSAGFTMRQKVFIESEEKYFAPALERFEKDCGAKLEAKIDWASFQPVLDDLIDGTLHKSAYSYCKAAIDQMSWMCTSSKVNKSGISSGVRSFECHYGGEGKRALKVHRKKKHLDYWVDFNSKNDGVFVGEQLGKSL